MAEEKQYPTDERGQLDARPERDTREPPCTVRTWCVRSEHDGLGPCVEAPKYKIEPSDYGPGRAKK